MTETKRRILIVDDELDAVQGHIEEVGKAGFDVTVFRSTDEALREFIDGDVAVFDLPERTR